MPHRCQWFQRTNECASYTSYKYISDGGHLLLRYWWKLRQGSTIQNLNGQNVVRSKFKILLAVQRNAECFTISEIEQYNISTSMKTNNYYLSWPVGHVQHTNLSLWFCSTYIDKKDGHCWSTVTCPIAINCFNYMKTALDRHSRTKHLLWTVIRVSTCNIYQFFF